MEDKTLKPGQLFTCNKHVYRVRAMRRSMVEQGYSRCVVCTYTNTRFPELGNTCVQHNYKLVEICLNRLNKHHYPVLIKK